MKEYKKKVILILLIATYILTASACDFIVKDNPIDIESNYSTAETPDTVDVISSKDVESESSKETDTAHENESKADSEKDKSSSSENKTDSSKSSSSKVVSSRIISSRASSSSSNTSSKTTSSSSEVKVTKIALDVYEVTLDIGQSKMPVVTMTPYNAVNKREVWKSSNESVATVDKNGVIRAVAEGKCVVTVTAEGNPSVDAKVNVTVKGKPKVDSLDVSFTEATINVGETVMPRVTMLPLDADTLAEKWTSDNESVATVDSYGYITGRAKGTCKITVTSVSNDKLSKEITVTVNEQDNTGDDEYTNKYIDGVLIVNKTYGLSRSYNPGGLTPECASAFESLRRAAAEDGINIYIESGFRSYEEQESLYEQYVNSRGKEAADTFSARPGHSEHQTGLTIDCNNASDEFVGTAEAQWLAEHSCEYGFIIRYPLGKEDITGYKYEPWHIRYVGKELAKELYNSGETLEEHFNIKSEYRD